MPMDCGTFAYIPSDYLWTLAGSDMLQYAVCTIKCSKQGLEFDVTVGKGS